MERGDRGERRTGWRLLERGEKTRIGRKVGENGREEKRKMRGNGVEDENEGRTGSRGTLRKEKRRVADKKEKNKASMKMDIYIFLWGTWENC